MNRTQCWILQDAAGHHYTQSRVTEVVKHFPTQESAASHGRYWAPTYTPVQLPYRCYLLECDCDGPDAEGCASPDHTAESGCVSLMHGHDEDEARARALAGLWEEASTDREGRSLLMCDSCA